MNTPDTTPPGNIHGMSLAASLGQGDERLTRIGGFSPKIRPEHTVLLGVRDLDPVEAPGTGTPVKGGLSYREAHLVLELLHESGIVTSAELVEVNPSLDTGQKTAQLDVDLLASLLGEQIL